MSRDEPDLSTARAGGASGAESDPADALRRILARMAWRDWPSVGIHYDANDDVLTATILRLPPVRERYPFVRLRVLLDGRDDLALPTQVRLEEFVASQRTDAAMMARQLIGPTAWRRAVEMTVDGTTEAEVELNPLERDGLLSGWASFAREVRVVGIQVLPRLLRGVLIDDLGRVIAAKDCPLPAMDPGSVAEGAASLALDLWHLDSARGSLQRAVGVQIGGPVDSENGVVHHYNKGGLGDAHWEDVKLGELIEGRLESQVLVVNDVASLAVYEQWFGLGRLLQRYGLILVSEGIGGAMVGHGSIDEDSPMELGNIVIHQDGRKCQCGSYGCVEATAGTWALVEQASEEAGHQVATLSEAAALADADDEHIATMVRRVFQKAGQDLAVGIGSVQALLAPPAWAVYLPAELDDSGIAGHEFWAGIEQFATWVSFKPFRKCSLHRRRSAGDEGPLGAALAALERFGLSSTNAVRNSQSTR